MTTTNPSGANGLDTSAKDANGLAGTGAPNGPPAAMLKASENVLFSDIGITVLLGRLKQSLASVRDFSAFLKRRSALEEEHAAGLRKIGRINYETAQKSETRSGSYATQLAEMTKSHERVADNGHRFAEALLHIHDELNELSTNIERSRKQWKQEGLNNEKRVKDAESTMDKAKARYDSSADSYDRVRTGDSSGRTFGIKGPKSAEQREEDLKNKMQIADADYAAKVQAAQAARQENLTQLRPQAVKALQDLIGECDNALTLQLQRFAAFNEKLYVSNGLIVSPIRSPDEAAVGPPSMRETIARIDNERDFHTYVTGHSSNVPPRPADIKYEKHPSQTTSAAPSMPPTLSQVPPGSSSGPVISGPSPTVASGPSGLNSRPGTQPAPSSSPQNQTFQQGRQQTPDRSFKAPGQPPMNTSVSSVQSPKSASALSPQQAQPAPAYSSQKTPAAAPAYSSARSASGPAPSAAQQQQRTPNGAQLPPPYNRVFGLSLDELYRRDDSAVPIVVYQCIQAVDLFGLDVEGIYRTSGNSNHIVALRAQFDHDASKVDFRNPENFHHDVSDAAGLLKQFLRELPDPLFTKEHYPEFISAAKIDDDVQRRDSLHAIINSLPDPNYATLRAIVLHLWRVQEHSSSNRMTTHNIALCLAPSLLGQQTNSQMVDAGLQARVLDTILQNTYQIFDED